jgi:DNA-binding HxlR family transcriptional regulator
MKPKSVSVSPFEYWTPGTPMVPAAPLIGCPVQASLGVLGRKWTMLILREMSMRNVQRFSEMMRAIDGLTPRILSARLKELEEDGIIKKTGEDGSQAVRWSLTEKGWDALPILMGFFAYGLKWYPEMVFSDGRAREISEVYPQKNLKKTYVNLKVSSPFEQQPQTPQVRNQDNR